MKKLDYLGQYVTLNCKNCGKLNGKFTNDEYFGVDCDCTLFSEGFRFRSTNLPQHRKERV